MSSSQAVVRSLDMNGKKAQSTICCITLKICVIHAASPINGDCDRDKRAGENTH